MRGFATWFLGFTLVGQLVITLNMLQVSYVQRLLAPNEEMVGALRGQVSGWTLTGIFGLISLVLFVILTRLVRRDLAKAVRPCESSRDQGPPEPGSRPPQQT
jgi:hypothetical protein